MNYKITINGTEYEVHIHKVEGSKAYLTVNDVDVEALGHVGVFGHVQ